MEKKEERREIVHTVDNIYITELVNQFNQDLSVKLMKNSIFAREADMRKKNVKR